MKNKMPELQTGMLVTVMGFRELLAIAKIDTMDDESVCFSAVSTAARMMAEGLNDKMVVAVYKPKDAIQRDCKGGIGEYVTMSYDRIWLRPKLREMTIEQIEDELGHPVKIIKS